jgi:hypothetical protein
MKPDEYLRMLDDRIRECEHNTKVAHRTYMAESAKLKAAMEARVMYEKLLREE